jgi:hypothetical protein
MTVEELFNLPDGNYEAVLEDLSIYKYQVKVESDRSFKSSTSNYDYKKWIEIKLSSPNSIYDIVYATKSAADYILFSTEAVSGLTISTTMEPAWLEYFKIKEKDE